MPMSEAVQILRHKAAPTFREFCCFPGRLESA